MLRATLVHIPVAIKRITNVFDNHSEPRDTFDHYNLHFCLIEILFNIGFTVIKGTYKTQYNVNKENIHAFSSISNMFSDEKLSY